MSRFHVGCFDGAPGFVNGGEDLPCVLEESGSCREQRDASRVAREKRCPEFVLQCAELSAQRGLADVEPLCGASDVQLFGDRYEVLELDQAHALDCNSTGAALEGARRVMQKRYWTDGPAGGTTA